MDQYTDTETVDMLRALRRAGDHETLLNLGALYEVMARGLWREIPRARPETAEEGLWVYDRHTKTCGECTCPPVAVRQCAGPRCEVAIVSVKPEPRQYCSNSCSVKAHYWRTAHLDKALEQLLRENGGRLEESEAARLLEVERARLHDAARRLNREGKRVQRTKEANRGAWGGVEWHLVLVGRAASA
jgi:hypothetical protein